MIGLTYGTNHVAADYEWAAFLGAQQSDEPLQFEQVPFDHPLWTLFSSGTTGLPKAVVHSHGGITLEHLKLHALHFDTRPGDRVMLMATTGWTVWNAMVSALMRGASIVLTDGNPFYPDLEEPWRTVPRTGSLSSAPAPAF